MLLDELWGEVFAPLRDEHLFLTAHQNNDLGTVVWANGADLAPEFLLQLLQAQRTSSPASTPNKPRSASSASATSVCP